MFHRYRIVRIAGIKTLLVIECAGVGKSLKLVLLSNQRNMRVLIKMNYAFSKKLPGQCFQQAGFTAARSADDRETFALLNSERNIL